jgi:hypothetical protein
MIRAKPSIQKPIKQVCKRKSVGHAESENIRPLCFNTKGYFNPEEPFDSEYLKVKEEVFKKYRNKNGEYVMLDSKNTKKSAFIQKGLQMPSINISNLHELSSQPLT